MNFDIEQFSVRRISDNGLWLVTTRHVVDIGLLFLRFQEFFESANREFCGRKFQLVDFIRWQCTKKEGELSFNYFEHFEGFNVPGEVMDQCLKIRWDDENRYDEVMRRVVERIRAVDERYYLIGAAIKNAAVIDHEIAHGLFYLDPEYRERMTALVDALGPRRYDMMEVLRDEGYGDNVLVDEIHAYMSTGLMEGLYHMDRHRIPFMQLFSEFRDKHVHNA